MRYFDHKIPICAYIFGHFEQKRWLFSVTKTGNAVFSLGAEAIRVSGSNFIESFLQKVNLQFLEFANNL